jgi:hypothetical protein
MNRPVAVGATISKRKTGSVGRGNEARIDQRKLHSGG